MIARSSVVLPAPFGPDDRRQLAGLEAKVDVPQHVDVAVAGTDAADVKHQATVPV